MSRGGGGGVLRPVAPGFPAVPWGTPNPTADGTQGPLGRPKTLPPGNTPQTDALIAQLKQRYPGIHLSSYRSPEVQAGIRARGTHKHGADVSRWVASKYGSSHVWGTAIDAQVGPHMWEQFKADMRARGLRAYDEGTHIHVDDRTDLPNGPSEGRRR